MYWRRVKYWRHNKNSSCITLLGLLNSIQMHKLLLVLDFTIFIWFVQRSILILSCCFEFRCTKSYFRCIEVFTIVNFSAQMPLVNESFSIILMNHYSFILLCATIGTTQSAFVVFMLMIIYVSSVGKYLFAAGFWVQHSVCPS